MRRTSCSLLTYLLFSLDEYLSPPVFQALPPSLRLPDLELRPPTLDVFTRVFTHDSGQEGDSQAIQEAQALQEVGKGEGGDGRKKGRGKDPHDKVISKKKAKRAGRKGVKKNADINMQPVEGMPSDVLEQLYEHYWLVLEGEMVHKCTYIYIHFCPSLSIYERDVSVPTYYVCVHVHMNVYIYVCIYIYICVVCV